MKKYFLILLFILISNYGFSQKNEPIQINVYRPEVRVVMGICILGVGFSNQPNVGRLYPKPLFHYPQFIIPVSIGATLTICGILEGLERERTIKEFNDTDFYYGNLYIE